MVPYLCSGHFPTDPDMRSVEGEGSDGTSSTGSTIVGFSSVNRYPQQRRQNHNCTSSERPRTELPATILEVAILWIRVQVCWQGSLWKLGLLLLPVLYFTCSMDGGLDSLRLSIQQLTATPNLHDDISKLNRATLAHVCTSNHWNWWILTPAMCQQYTLL